MEHWEELLSVVLEWPFLPLAAASLLLVTAGTGLWKARRKKTLWAVGLLLLAFVLYFGVQRHEWGEVLFNGQLL